MTKCDRSDEQDERDRLRFARQSCELSERIGSGKRGRILSQPAQVMVGEAERCQVVLLRP